MSNNPYEHSDMIGLTPWSTVDYRAKFLYMVPPYVHPSNYTSWREENITWKKTGYIFAGLTLTPSGYIDGPDVIQFLSENTTNSYKNFPVGKTKHVMICREDGNIVMHGLVLRIAEDKVWTTTLYPWLVTLAKKKDYRLSFENTQYSTFIFQSGGAAILNSLEAACGEDLHDIPFLGFRNASIKGHPVRILRMSMSGTLGYEVHGATEYAKEIFAAVEEAGKPYGLQKIGWEGYNANITENGMPQEVASFTTCARDDKFFMDGLIEQGYNIHQWPGHPVLLGSSADRGIERYFRNPIELGWDVSVQDGHDYPGRERLLALKKAPERRTVTLVWNSEDVIDLLASYYRKDEEPYKWLDYPVHNYFSPGLDQDEVFDMDGNNIGVSAAASYTEYSREMLSLGTIDVKYIKPGTEVYLLWGEPGTRQKKVRAIVSKYPYLDLPSNMDFDVETIPHIFV